MNVQVETRSIISTKSLQNIVSISCPYSCLSYSHLLASRQHSVPVVGWRLQIGPLHSAALRIGYGTADSILVLSVSVNTKIFSPFPRPIHILFLLRSKEIGPPDDLICD